MPFFGRSDQWWDPWDTSRIFETHFGSNLTDDDLFGPITPNSLYLRRRPFSRQLSGFGPRSLVPQSGLSDLSQQSDKFQVMVDVSHFTPEEITVKTVDNTIVVSAKHEDRADDYGFVSRQFSRKYLIPQDIDPLSITSTLSPEGILTIQAPKKQPELKEGERVVPITPGPPLSPQPKQIVVENVQNEGSTAN